MIVHKQLSPADLPQLQTASPDLTLDRASAPKIPQMDEERKHFRPTAPPEQAPSRIDELVGQSKPTTAPQSNLSLDFQSIKLPGGLSLPAGMSVEENADQFRYRFSPGEQWEVLYKKGSEPPPGEDGSQQTPFFEISAGPNSDPDRDGVVDRLTVISEGMEEGEKEILTLVLNPDVCSQRMKEWITEAGQKPLRPGLVASHAMREITDDPYYEPIGELEKSGLKLGDPESETGGLASIGYTRDADGERQIEVKLRGARDDGVAWSSRTFKASSFEVRLPSPPDSNGNGTLDSLTIKSLHPDKKDFEIVIDPQVGKVTSLFPD